MVNFFKNTLGKITVLIATIAMIAVNGMSMFPIINGKTTQQISDSYPNLFTPTGSTFSIWGIIYLALIIFAVMQLLPDKKNAYTQSEDAIAKIRLFYTLSCLINMGWLILWQFDQISLTVLLMLGLLLCLIIISLTLKKAAIKGPLGFILKTAFGLYLGWITVATIANITVFLVKIGWNGGSIAPEWWMIGILVVGTLIGCSSIFYLKNPAYGLVLLWAFWGILQQHLSSGIHAGRYPAIINTVIVCMVLFLIDTVVTTVILIRKKPETVKK